MANQSERFVWLRYPEVEAFIGRLVDSFVEAMPQALVLASELTERTGSRLLDWLDHLVVADGDQIRVQLADLGFEREDAPAEPGDRPTFYPGALFPAIVLRPGTGAPVGEVIAAAIQVEDVSHFLMMHRLASDIKGSVVSPYRRAAAWRANGRELLVVERRGHRGYVPVDMPADYPERYLRAFELWATRPRLFASEREGMEQTLRLAQKMVSDMGTDTAAWIAFSAERAYWQRRNRAGQIQKARQDSLGLGWANHDHHTYRSSRVVFPLLIEILETFGFRPRERFYAGVEAGWGAQVLEQSTCRFAVFADVDLSPDEVEGGLQRALPPREELGTIGLWCALHGQSMLSAGLHHLASRFDFDEVTAGLEEWGIRTMRPFSEFPYLQQAFTQGERWMVAPDRLDSLVADGQIDRAQRAAFEQKGAIGSHLENIQRGEGFKGFNQQTISDIIRRTDPRR